MAHLQIHPRALNAFLLLERFDQPSGRHLSHTQMLVKDFFHRPGTNLDLMGYSANSYVSIFQNGSLNLMNRCLIKGRRGRPDLRAVSTEFRPSLNSQCQRFTRSYDEASSPQVTFISSKVFLGVRPFKYKKRITARHSTGSISHFTQFKHL